MNLASWQSIQKEAEVLQGFNTKRHFSASMNAIYCDCAALLRLGTVSVYSLATVTESLLECKIGQLGHPSLHDQIGKEKNHIKIFKAIILDLQLRLPYPI